MNKALRALALIICCLFFLSIVPKLHSMQKFWSDEPSTRSVERYDSLTGFDITKYIQSIKINDVSHFIEGNIKAYVTAENNLTEMKYELMGGTLAVTQVLVNDSVSAFTHTNGIISIPVSFSTGQQFTTTVYYSGVPALSPSPYSIGMKFNTTGVYTLSNPDAGRYYWPCYDTPGTKRCWSSTSLCAVTGWWLDKAPAAGLPITAMAPGRITGQCQPPSPPMSSVLQQQLLWNTTRWQAPSRFRTSSLLQIWLMRRFPFPMCRI